MEELVKQLEEQLKETKVAAFDQDQEARKMLKSVSQRCQELENALMEIASVIGMDLEQSISIESIIERLKEFIK